ncbi:MAG TPA: rhomboid family intramembrane serine protease [Solirubrobacterales bacterium]|nr:rhomboid family intramembrane serine protease [Solirubrobacterales bacterium]
MIPLRDNIPNDRFPVVTLVFIAINVAVFLFLQGPSFSFSGGDAVDTKPVVEYGAIPYRITHPDKECDLVPAERTTANIDTQVCEGTPEYEEATAANAIEDLNEPHPFITILTSMFMHGGWLHIIFNMLFLWIFGNNVEDAMGRVRYVAFYLLGGVAAALAQVAVSPDSTIPLVGASGAIAAVLGGYALLYPFARVLTLFFAFFIFILEVPALVLLGIWIVLQFLPAVGQLATPELGDSGGVAYFAHIGGFLFGLAAVHLFAHRRSSEYRGREPRYPVY